jgi:hypothetical protein
MPIRYLKKYAALEGHVSAEDAETLQQWLNSQSSPAVNMGKCDQVHAAALQVLLALRPRLLSPPADPWLRNALEGR